MAVRAIPLGADRVAWRRAEEASRRSWRLSVGVADPGGAAGHRGPGGDPVGVVGGRPAGRPRLALLLPAPADVARWRSGGAGGGGDGAGAVVAAARLPHLRGHGGAAGRGADHRDCRRGGAERWISLGPVLLQPSEFAKPATVLFLATLVSRKEDSMHRFRDFLWPVALSVGVVGALVVVQPDLGTTLLIAIGGFAVLVASAAPLAFVLGGGTIGVAFAVAAAMISPYRVGAGHLLPQLGSRSPRHRVPGDAVAGGSGHRRALRSRAWGPAGRAGRSSPTRTPTSSSPSSARRPAWPAR